MLTFFAVKSHDAKGVPLWLSGVRIQRCHSCGSGLIPGPGISTCHGHSQKESWPEDLHCELPVGDFFISRALITIYMLMPSEFVSVIHLPWVQYFYTQLAFTPPFRFLIQIQTWTEPNLPPSPALATSVKGDTMYQITDEKILKPLPFLFAPYFF